MKQETIDRIRKFTEDRDWDQFHSPANLAKSIVIEAAELLECFQWSDEEYDLQHIKEELADVMVYSQNLLDVDAAVSDDAAGNRTLKLCLQISDVSLLLRKNLCTGHSVSPRFKNLYRKLVSNEKSLFPALGRERGIKQLYARFSAGGIALRWTPAPAVSKTA